MKPPAIGGMSHVHIRDQAGASASADNHDAADLEFVASAFARV
jgi:hypothetical protein